MAEELRPAPLRVRRRRPNLAWTMPRGIASILRNTSYVLTNHIATTLLATFSAIVIARILGPEMYGTLTYGYSWYLTLIALTYLGLDVVLGREIARDRSAAPELSGVTLIVRAGAAVLVALVSAGAALVIESDEAVRKLLLVLSFALFARAIWIWCTSVFIAFENTRYILTIDLVFRPLEIAAILAAILLFWPNSIVAIAMVHAACWSLQAMVGTAAVFAYVTPLSFSLSTSRLVQLLKPGFAGALYTITVVSFLQAPIVLFRQVSGTGEMLGHFALAVQLLGYLLVIPYLVASVGLPVLSRSAARGDGKTRNAAIAMIVLIPLCGALIGILAIWLAPALLELAFGPDYVPAGRILGEAIWLLIPMSLATNLQQVVFSHGRRLPTGSISGVLGIVLMAALYEPLTHLLSYHGALLATGLGMTVWACGLIFALVKAGILSSP